MSSLEESSHPSVHRDYAKPLRQRRAVRGDQDRRSVRSSPHTRRVDSSEVQAEVDLLLEKIGLKERQFLYRYLADVLEVHPTTILRYHLGELETAPGELMDALQELSRRLERGEAIPFHRGCIRGSVVLRDRLVERLDEILTRGIYRHKTELFRSIEQKLGLRSGLIERIYYDRKRRFVTEEVYRYAEELAARIEYDPCSSYEVGERLCHPVFGTGLVCEKIPQNKLKIDFDDGTSRVLREKVRIDPCRRSVE